MIPMISEEYDMSQELPGFLANITILPSFTEEKIH
jgi:hypothetical protein